MSDKKNEFSRKRSRLMFMLSQMPPKVHWDKESDFDPLKSEVCQWLATQPEFMNWAMQKAKDLGAIEYKDEKWVGVNYGVKPPS